MTLERWKNRLNEREVSRTTRLHKRGPVHERLHNDKTSDKGFILDAAETGDTGVSVTTDTDCTERDGRECKRYKGLRLMEIVYHLMWDC